LCVGFIFDFRRKSHTFSSLFHIDIVSPHCIIHLLLLIFLVYGISLEYWGIEVAMLFVILIFVLLLLTFSLDVSPNLCSFQWNWAPFSIIFFPNTSKTHSKLSIFNQKLFQKSQISYLQTPLYTHIVMFSKFNTKRIVQTIRLIDYKQPLY
jgi:hypothetical protein